MYTREERQATAEELHKRLQTQKVTGVSWLHLTLLISFEDGITLEVDTDGGVEPIRVHLE